MNGARFDRTSGRALFHVSVALIGANARDFLKADWLPKPPRCRDDCSIVMRRNALALMPCGNRWIGPIKISRHLFEVVPYRKNLLHA